MTTQNDTNTLRSWLCRATLGGADRLAAYQEGALPPTSAARVERHLVACSACREELATLRQVSALLLARRPAAPMPARDLWRRIQAEIEAAPAPAVRRRPVFLAPALGTAAMAALAAVAVLTSSRPGTDKPSHPMLPGNGGTARPIARTTPGATTGTPKLGSDGGSTLGNGARTGRRIARAASGLPAKSGQSRASSFVPDKQIAAMRSLNASESRDDSPAAQDPFRPLRVRNEQRRLVAKSNRRRARAAAATFAVVASARSVRPETDPATKSAPLDQTSGTTTTPPAPGGGTSGNEEPSPTIASTAALGGASAASSGATSVAVASAEDPSGPSPTLTAARGVAADDSAVTRYLSDNRRNGLFRYASSQVVSPSQPELLR